MIEVNWEKAKQFVDNLYILIQKNYDPLGPYVQAAHETFFFKKLIGNNFWGMKCPRSWPGLYKEIATHEQIKDKVYATRARFVDFNDIKDSFLFYDKQIRRLYINAYDHRVVANSFFGGLVSGKFKWATDSEYVNKLNLRLNQIIKDEIQFKMLSPLIKIHKQNIERNLGGLNAG